MHRSIHLLDKTTQSERHHGPRSSERKGSGFVKRAYALRSVGLAIGLAPVETVFWTQHTSAWMKLFVAFYCLAWPHIGYLNARRSSRPGRSEFCNVIADNLIGGLIVVAMKFELLPSTLVILMFMMNDIAAGGLRLLAKGSFACVAGLLLGIAFCGSAVELQSSYTITIACLPLLVVYPLSLGFMSHLTSLKLAERSKALKYLSEHDPLTGLFNRSTFSRQLFALVEEAQHNASRVSVMFIDLDDFKTVNDSYGHQIGDEFLIVVAARLLTLAGESEKVARYGGDEFAISSTRPTIGAVQDIAADLIRLVNEPIVVSGVELRACMSIGISTWPEHGKDCQALMKGADAAMYAAKTSGRNRFVTFDPKYLM